MSEIVIQLDLNHLGLCLMFVSSDLLDKESWNKRIRQQLTFARNQYDWRPDLDLEEVISNVIESHPFNKQPIEYESSRNDVESKETESSDELDTPQ